MTARSLLVALALVAGAIAYTPANPSLAAALDEQPVALADPAAQEEDAEGETRDRPWVPILVIALAIPIAVLAIPSFFGKGSSGSH